MVLIPAYNPCGGASLGYTTEEKVVVRDEDEEVLEGHVVVVQLIMVGITHLRYGIYSCRLNLGRRINHCYDYCVGQADNIKYLYKVVTHNGS